MLGPLVLLSRIVHALHIALGLAGSYLFCVTQIAATLIVSQTRSSSLELKAEVNGTGMIRIGAELAIEGSLQIGLAVGTRDHDQRNALANELEVKVKSETMPWSLREPAEVVGVCENRSSTPQDPRREFERARGSRLNVRYLFQAVIRGIVIGIIAMVAATLIFSQTRSKIERPENEVNGTGMIRIGAELAIEGSLQIGLAVGTRDHDQRNALAPLGGWPRRV